MQTRGGSLVTGYSWTLMIALWCVENTDPNLALVSNHPICPVPTLHIQHQYIKQKVQRKVLVESLKHNHLEKLLISILHYFVT